MFFYKYWFNKLKPIVYTQHAEKKQSFSIIIPARNEAANIGKLLQCLVQQTYATNHFEVIVIDDFSTDETATIVTNFAKKHPHIKLLSLEKIVGTTAINSYKKKAIELAIAKSQYDWIITTDADCTVGVDWLNSYNNYIVANQYVFITAPVLFTNNGSWLQQFQQLDFMGLQGITAAAVSAGVHAMCNGANLCYNKAAFNAVGGFKEIDTIASGDDMLLMTKMKKHYPTKIGYLFCKEAVVETAPMPTVFEFMQQRIRWASKTNSYKEKTTVIALWIVLLVNIGLFIMPLLAVFYGIFILYYWLLLLATKTIVEGMFAVKIAAFFNVTLPARIILLQYLHVAYTSIAGILGGFPLKYKWKGRTVR